jgi:outer membrane protein assembly factor BamB
MKKQLKKSVCAMAACLLLTGITQNLQAQCSFLKVWESKLENDAGYKKYTSEDGSLVIGSTKKEICVLNGDKGQKIWSGTFADIAGAKEADAQEFLEGAGQFFIINNQKGKDQLVCIDIKTGKKLWANEDFESISLESMQFIQPIQSIAVVMKRGLVMLDAQSGKVKWTLSGFVGALGRWAYLKDTKQLVLLNYNPNALKSLVKGFKNQLMCVNAESGQVAWEQTFKEIIEMKRFAAQSFTFTDWVVTGIEQGIGSSNILVDLFVKNNKVFLMFNGLTVFDLKDGKKLWEADYNVSLNRGVAGASQLYDAVAKPIVTDQYVYVADFREGSRKKAIVKYDLETGKQVWECEIDGRNVIIPNMSLVNGTVVLQIGGRVNKQGEDKTGYFKTYYSKWEWQGPFGLKGIDDATGKLKWETEKFDDRVSNILAMNNNLYVADKSSLYTINISNGEKLKEINLKKTSAGKPVHIFSFSDKVMVFCEDGLDAFSANGDLLYSIVNKDASSDKSEMKGDCFFLAGDDEVIALNLADGKVYGNFKFKKGYDYGVKNNGESFFMYHDEAVTRYKVK